ncbi:hypothetical protein OTB20_01395 [Streptomyces sp. H27-H1]|uniref:hypothetical protein n=1 Tax=Streptomyces sp. H27-H1 TaxID=2996461 RepID=UPI00226EC813|nr:hypothetical protein [Streptomyces sp. H27-H1]MCY0924891.1 hypothetical protein [Streptomyces sp. H27-H1]
MGRPALTPAAGVLLSAATELLRSALPVVGACTGEDLVAHTSGAGTGRALAWVRRGPRPGRIRRTRGRSIAGIVRDVRGPQTKMSAVQ